jgi:general stress protein YciG
MGAGVLAIPPKFRLGRMEAGALRRQKMTEKMYYVFDFDGKTRTRKEYKTLSGAKKAAETTYDKTVYVENDYGNLRPVDPVSVAAAALGRKGGKAKSQEKTDAVRENGKKGGRPKQDPEYIAWKRDYEAKHPVGQSSHSGLWGWGSVNDGLDLSTCKYDTEAAAKRARSTGLYEYYLGEKRNLEDARKGIY